MKKLLLTTALAVVLASPVMAKDLPYSMQRSDENVSTIAPAAGEETPADTAAPAVPPEAAAEPGATAPVPAAEPATSAPTSIQPEAQPEAPSSAPKHVPAKREPKIQMATPETAPAETAPAAGSSEPNAALAPAASGDWNYADAANWGNVNPVCKNGTKQSPINISKFFQEAQPELKANYAPTSFSLLNDGHTLQFAYPEGSGFSVDGMEYKLKMIDFHTPSEHYMDGAPYPMELQMVHQSADGSPAIIAVMVKAGGHNKFIEALWQNAPAHKGGTKVVPDVRLSAADLMPQSLAYYRYDGSLTTPPCTENVQWFVLKEPIEVSEEQIKTFQKMFPMNARPVQSLGERVVTGD